MATDRITEVTVRFEDATGKEVLVRTYKMKPEDTYIKANNPQGLNPGSLQVNGPVLSYSDKGGRQ